MKLIQTKTITSAQPSIEFTDIPQNFQDLVLKVSARGDVNNTAVKIQFNNSTSNLSTRYLYGSGSAAQSFSDASNIYLYANSSSYTASTFGNSEVYIPNYSGSTNKSVSVDAVTENNATAADMAIFAGLWANTAAITSIKLIPNSGNFVSGSTISLYGIGGLAGGAPKATGGTITRSGEYWLHTFTSSGTFTTLADISNLEYLVVAGGGGGGGNTAIANGGGGAGGYRSSVVGQSSGGGASAEARLSLSSGTNHTVTVGAGGSGASQTNGVNSVFGSITSIGGGRGGATSSTNGNTGGSGGGAGYAGSSIGSGTTGQGYAGGVGSSPAPGVAGGGGGGGAGQLGQNTSGSNAGNGGNGVSSSITGSAVTRAGGGGAGSYNLAVGNGGTGGGGVGGRDLSSGPSSGTANTGGGGGGSGGSEAGGNGGSGIVVVRYLA